MEQKLTSEHQDEEPWRKANKIVGGSFTLGGILVDLKLLAKVIFSPHTFNGPTTSEVLGNIHADDPRTVYDRLRVNRMAFRLQMSYFMEPEVETDVLWLREWRAIMLRYDHFASLPSSLSNAYHVYIVTSTDISWHNLWVHSSHWSLYTQGCFFHLGISDSVEHEPVSSAPRGKFARAGLKLNIEVFSEHTSTGFKRTSLESSKKAFTALEVGLTQYNVDEVRCLAENIIERIDKYAIRGANCHNFVVNLMVRLLMGKRDYSIFVGTKDQIVDWDINRYTGQRTHTDGLETGFLVREPMTQRFRIPPIINPAHQLTIRRINNAGKLYTTVQG